MQANDVCDFCPRLSNFGAWDLWASRGRPLPASRPFPSFLGARFRGNATWRRRRDTNYSGEREVIQHNGQRPIANVRRQEKTSNKVRTRLKCFRPSVRNIRNLASFTGEHVSVRLLVVLPTTEYIFVFPCFQEDLREMTY